MAIWPFNRRKQSSTQKPVPKEVEQYYQSERRDRVGVAWLLAGVTLILTVMIVLGLFFGGRWAYRKITNKDNTTNTQTAETNQPNKPAEQSPSNQSPSSSSPSSTDNSNTSSPNNSSSQTSPSQGSVAAPTQTNNPASVPSGPTQTSVPNTGPGQTITVFALVSLAGYIGYSTYLRRKLN